MGITCYRFGTESGVMSTPPVQGTMYAKYRSLDIHFSTGGWQRGTSWRVEIGPASFDTLARLMMNVDPVKATKAFANALGARDSDQPE